MVLKLQDRKDRRLSLYCKRQPKNKAHTMLRCLPLLSLLGCAAFLVSSTMAFQPPSFHRKPMHLMMTNKEATTTDSPIFHALATSVAAVALFLAPLPATAASSSDAAAQIALNSLPPTSIRIQIQDLPVIGPLLSGTYTKVDDSAVTSQPSVLIRSPKDKIKAISSAVKSGHLEFDVTSPSVKVLNTHVDVDIAADQAGMAQVFIQSPLIPKLPFKSSASTSTTGKEGPWSIVTNLGSGESYYFNAKTGVTQLDRPQL